MEVFQTNFISKKLISFSPDGVSVFQGYRTLMLLCNYNPNFLIHDWCSLHCALDKPSCPNLLYSTYGQSS